MRVVPVETVALGSGAPGPATGTDIPVAGLTTLPAGGTYVVQGTVEFFDFS